MVLFIPVVVRGQRPGTQTLFYEHNELVTEFSHIQSSKNLKDLPYPLAMIQQAKIASITRSHTYFKRICLLFLPSWSHDTYPGGKYSMMPLGGYLSFRGRKVTQTGPPEEHIPTSM